MRIDKNSLLWFLSTVTDYDIDINEDEISADGQSYSIVNIYKAYKEQRNEKLNRINDISL